MAFGRGFVSGGGGAGRADVTFRAVTGQFKADVNEARQVYQRTTGQMSDSALRMAVAQEKLDRAIHKYGAESRQAKQATIAYRSEMRSLQGQVDRTGREFDQTRRQMDRTFRGALAGSGIFKSLRGSIAFASSAFLGGAGFIYALRSTINAAKDSEVVLGQLEAALSAVGISYQQNRKQIEETIRAQSRLAAFDDEELTRTFITLVRRTEDVNEALRLNALVTELARGRNISLEAALMIVLKASLGQAGALRRVGLEVDKNAKSTELLALLQRKYAGSAKAYGDDAAGAQERWNVALENAQEIVGSGLLPTLTDLFNQGAAWLDQQADSGELQRKVNEAVETGTEAVKGITSALRAVHAVGKPVVNALGGIENAARAATLLWVAWKVKAIAGFAATAASSALTRNKMIADAAAIGAALDVATRPRNVVITTTGVPGGGRGGGRGSPGLPVPVPGRGVPPFARGLGVAGLAVAIGLTLFPPSRGDRRGPLTRAALEAAERGQRLDPEVMEILGEWVTKPSSILDASQAELDEAERRLRELARGRAPLPPRPGVGAVGSGDLPGDRPDAGGGTRPDGRRGGRRPRPRTLADIQLDVARAGATTGTRADDARVLGELREFYARQIRALEARKRLTAEQKERLRSLYGDLASVQSQLEAIATEGERKLEEQQEKALERARRSARLQLGRVGAGGGARDEVGRPGIGGGVGRGTGGRAGGAKGGGLTEADIRRMHFEFLGALQGVMNQFGGNLFPPGSFSGMDQAGTQSIVQSALLRDLIHEVRALTSGVRHPGAKYARIELSSAYGGVGGI